VIHPIGERQWKDVNWNGQEYHMCGQLMSRCTLMDPLALRQYDNQGSFQDVVVKMF
jgi:hypothetical protein